MNLRFALPKLGRTARMALVVLGLGAACLGYTIVTLETRLEEGDEDLRAMRNRVTASTRELSLLRNDVVFVNENIERFKSMTERGLLASADRLDALQRIRDLARTLRLDPVYEFQPQRPVEVNDPALGGYRVVVTPIVLDIRALRDREILSLALRLPERLAGLAVVSKLNISRLPKLTDQVLDRLKAGEPVEVVSAQMEIAWRTVEEPPPESRGGRPIFERDDSAATNPTGEAEMPTDDSETGK